MRVGLNCIVTAIILCFLCSGIAAAMVKGDCVNCHTMHNSQDGSAFSTRVTVGEAAAFNPSDSLNYSVENLLINNCIGCHSSTGSETIVTLGESRIPIVYNVAKPNKPLAGGNFHWVQTLGDEYGHNVRTVDSILSRAPGTTASCGVGNGGNGGGSGLGGCHASLASIATSFDPVPVVGNGCIGCHDPAHHANDETVMLSGNAKYVDGTGGGYRFINQAGVKFIDNGGHRVPAMVGIEDPDWEQDPTSAIHNEYQDSPYDATGHGMSDFCTGCHDGYHSLRDADNALGVDDMGLPSSPWLRHPAGFVLPATGEYADYTVYDPQVPVARPNVAALKSMGGPSSTVSPGTDKVMCLSCHRVHGSEFPDMLRWSYDGMVASTTGGTAGTGCFVCHTLKDGVD